jgi:hypothetical protein
MLTQPHGLTWHTHLARELPVERPWHFDTARSLEVNQAPH